MSSKQAEEEAYRKANTIDDDQPDLEKYDELEHKQARIHCWVLIKRGKREVDE